MSQPDPDFVSFLRAYPTYPTTHIIDDLRATEYARLDVGGHIYLDYTGGGLYAESQLRRHNKLLAEHVFGNPHSSNPTSLAATQLVEHARQYVLNFFNADPEQYLAIFTSNASAALKLVGESYPFPNGRYLLTFDNHNSVNGIREFAHARGADVTYIPVALPDMRVDASHLSRELSQPSTRGHNLFAYPAQSNFSSVKHPLEWIAEAHQHGWDVLLDAAAFVPTSLLDLSIVKPDFVPISFYKMFGYPTGLGALVARKEALAKLQRPWFAGGTITVASVQGDKYYMADGASAFEDGTIDYLNIPAIEIGLKHIESIGYDVIHERVYSLTGWLLDNLTEMRHSTGVPLVRLYGPTKMVERGGAVTVNFYDKDNKGLDHRFIEQQANEAGISLRTGCFCNPGAGEIALGISRVELDVCFTRPGHEDRLTVDDFRNCIDGKSSGAVRISVGMVTNFKDVQGFLAFARTSFIMSQPPMDDDFQDRIQRILNEKKKEDLRKQYGMSFEGHSEEMSPQAEGEWLDSINEFEMQFENARQITVRERIGNPEVKPLAQILDSELADELDRLLGLLSENNIAIDFLHEQDEREMYRFITEELLDEETDDIRIPGMVSHFIYEEFHPNDEDDITDAIEEFVYALFQGEFKDPESMSYYTVSNENLQDADGKPLSLEEFKALVSDFYEAYPVITSHVVNVKNIIVDGDHATVDANIEWQGIPKNEKAILRKEGSSEFRLARSIYGGWDITQVSIPGWIFRAKS